MEHSRVLLQKNETFLCSCLFFIKEWDNYCVLSRSLQKNGTFFSLFWVSKVAKNSKKEWERMEHSLKERERPVRSERERTRCPTLTLRCP